MRCTDAHATSALCTPSRYGLLTGRYNWRSALKQVVIMGYTRHLIEDGRATLGTLFQRAGYRTAVVGKWHLGLDWAMEGDDTPFLPGAPLGMDQKTPVVDYSQPVQNGPNEFGFDYSYVTPGSLDIAPYAFLENGRVTAPPTGSSGDPNFYSAGPRGVVSDPNDPRVYTWPEGAIAADYVHEHVVPDSADRVLGLIDEYAGGEQPFFLYYPIHAPHLPCLPTPEFKGKSAIGPYGDMVLMIDSIAGRIMKKLEETGIAEGNLTQISQEIAESIHTIYHGYLCVTTAAKDAIRLQTGETVAYRWHRPAGFCTFAKTSGTAGMIDHQKNRLLPFLRERFPDENL